MMSFSFVNIKTMLIIDGISVWDVFWVVVAGVGKQVVVGCCGVGN